MYKIIRINTEVSELLEYLKDKDICAIDTETNGLTSEADIIGYSICCEDNLAYYVITAYWSVEEQALKFLETKDTAPSVFKALHGKSLIGHNILFDIDRINDNYGVDLIRSVHADTMIMAHLTDENRRVGLKELGAFYLGASAKAEQDAMKASVIANGGELTKDNYELYKADCNLIAEYGAKDALMTFQLATILTQELINEGLVEFFMGECMPLLRGPTRHLNTSGLKVDLAALEVLKKSLELETMELKASIYHDIEPFLKDLYPATNKKNTFNIGSGQQLAWLLFDKLENVFPKLSDTGQELCRALEMRVPYNNEDKRNFVNVVRERKGSVWKGTTKIRDYWTYLCTDKVVIERFSKKYRWVKALQDYKKAQKMLTTYVYGIAARTKYGIIQPNFKQHGTTSGRYSCSNPNFQQLPREDKRVKSCIVSRPGKLFVGLDHSQLEPRVFASISQDKALMECFAKGEDFYSVVGAPIFGVSGCSMVKDAPNSFAKKHPDLRDKAKVVTLATVYGRTAKQQAAAMGIDEEESRDIINRYFEAYPKVELMMLKYHQEAKFKGYVESMFGRKRRIVDALKIPKMFGDMEHGDLPYTARNLLNLACNHPIQSAGASITNRNMIDFLESVAKIAKDDTRWHSVRIVLQVHDSIVVECDEAIAEDVALVLQDSAENSVQLPGVKLQAIPKIGRTLAEV